MANTVVKRALNLRESVYRIFRSVAEGWQPEVEDLEKLNQELKLVRRHQKLSATESGFVFEWIDRSESLDRMLWQISKSATELLINGDLMMIRRCANDICNWLFLDTSRNRIRQWCVIKDCCNLEKVRRFRTKRQVG